MGHDRGKPRGSSFEGDARRGEPCHGSRQDKHAHLGLAFQICQVGNKGA